MWILGRIYCKGTPQDYKAVHEMQDKLSLVPLSSYGKSYTPPPGQVDRGIDMKTAVRDQVNAMGAAAYFKLLAALMKDNPPAEGDAPMLARDGEDRPRCGPGLRFRQARPGRGSGFGRRSRGRAEQIVAYMFHTGRIVNGWVIPLKTGIYGTDYLDRAAITWYGLGANRPQDAIYPTSQADADGKPYDGANRYVMHFDKGQTPPVDGFWSLTMYDAQYFFYPNHLNRYTLSARNALKHNADGSVDLYVQHESPGKMKESNWLPAPAGRFVLMLRLYWPKENPPSIIDGTWNPPPVKPAQ